MKSYSIFVQSLSETPQTFEVAPQYTVGAIKELIEERAGVEAGLQKLAYAGSILDNERTLAELEIGSGSTLYMTLALEGGKKGKKKVYTTKKKNKHKHQKVSLQALQYYSVDGQGVVTRTRKICPSPTCKFGIFMARHFDRLYCGKCKTTFKLDPSEVTAPTSKKKKDDKKEEADKKGKGKDAKKGKKK